MGAILGQVGDSLRALYYLRQSYQADPRNPQTVYGLAFAYMELGDIEQAQKHFQMVLDMSAPEEELQEDGCKGGEDGQEDEGGGTGDEGLIIAALSFLRPLSVRSVKI